MRYLKKEIWAKINDSDEKVRSRAEKEWVENDRLYSQRFKEVKERLPFSFLEEYLNRNCMHDYCITKLDITKRGKKYSCELHLKNGVDNVLIKMTDLKSVQVDITSFKYCILGELVWAYSEIDVTQENNITLAVLCDMQNELQFEFKEIDLIKL